jgi:hypothetical protein
MKRIFLLLAAVDGLAILTTFALGWTSMFRQGLTQVDDPIYLIHFQLGLYTTMGNLAVHCLIFIYFLGTGRWVKEVAIAYKIPDEPFPKLTRELKRKTFPPALFAMLITIATSAAGAGRQLREWPWYVHATLAIATLLINAWAFRVEYRNVCINADVIDRVLEIAEGIRAEAGLPCSAEAMRQGPV